MINFYREWKEDKESSREPTKKRIPPSNTCKICGKGVNGLKAHVEAAHGLGMWSRYLAAEAKIEQQKLDAFKRLL